MVFLNVVQMLSASHLLISSFELWNAVQFSMSKLEDDYVLPTNVNLDNLPFRYQWILLVLNRAIFKTIAALESYKFSNAASTYSWW